MKKSEVFKLLAFIILPAGFIAGGIYYGPKIKKWLEGKNKQTGDTEKNDSGTNG